jgi:predicted deacylase
MRVVPVEIGTIKVKLTALRFQSESRYRVEIDGASHGDELEAKEAVETVRAQVQQFVDELSTGRKRS